MTLDGKRIDPKRAEKRNAKIFCGGLKSDFDDESIKAVFQEHGEIELYERYNKIIFKNTNPCLLDAPIATPADHRHSVSSPSKTIK